MREIPLAIIGAGPAGLSAALQAAKLGIHTLVLDMHAQSGGHYFNLPPDELNSCQPAKEEIEGKSLIDQVKAAGAEILSSAEVWGIYPEDPFRICLSGNKAKEIRASKIILAPGAIERIWPFPGWTLPGVISAGGALTLLKNQKMSPGRKILISGTGPLQLSLAAQLASQDIEIAGLLELKPRRSILSGWRSAVGNMTYHRFREGLGYLRKIQAEKIPYLFGWSVIEAIGKNEVEGAVIARVDSAGKPISSTEKTIDVDCICLGYGLLPDTQFTRLLECDHVIHPQIGAWVPVRNEWLQTSLGGVFAAGDAAGVAGKVAAMLEGKIAALGAAIQLDQISGERASEEAAKIRRRLSVEYRFAEALQQIFSLPANPCSLANPETVICRCECITLAQIQEAVQDGATSVQAVKYHSRSGMGWCRGTSCTPLIGQIIAQYGKVNLEHASRSTTRPPLFPVPLEDALDHEV